MKKKKYETPEVQIIEVEHHQAVCFKASTGATAGGLIWEDEGEEIN